jgi:hypothetical protein
MQNKIDDINTMFGERAIINGKSREIGNIGRRTNKQKHNTI